MVSALGQSLKNGILFGLIVIVFHITLKTALNDKEEEPEDEEVEEQPAASAMATIDSDENIATIGVVEPPPSVQEAALKDYVFGGKDFPEPHIDMGIQGSEKVAAGGSDSDKGGRALIGEYANESELCGGSILKRGPREKSMGLQGFDGYFGSEVAMV